jgi:hypothetical protein
MPVPLVKSDPLKTAEDGSAFDQQPKEFHVMGIEFSDGGRGATQYASPTISDVVQSFVSTDGLAIANRLKLIPALLVMLPQESFATTVPPSTLEESCICYCRGKRTCLLPCPLHKFHLPVTHKEWPRE